MGDTEGCQRFIYSTVIESTRISTTNGGYFPRDFFKLRINSNDAYSKVTRPNNNCYDFVIQFPPSSAESIQFRIAQCNRYQVVDVKVPMRNSRGIGRGYYLPYNAPVRRHVPLTSDPDFITTLLAKTPCPSITRPDQFVLDDRVSLSPRDFARRYEPLEELHVGIHCHSFNEVDSSHHHNKTADKKYPPNQKFVDDEGKERVHLSHHQAMLLYDNTLHQKNPFYDRQSFCNYPPDSSAAALFANPRVIRPTFPPNLSSLHVRIFPNGSTQTYDKHIHDYPVGCETDLTLVFYHEHDTSL